MQSNFIAKLSDSGHHITESSWSNWQSGNYLGISLSQLFNENNAILTEVFERAHSLTEEYKETHICSFTAQPSIVAPIGDILTKVYELLDKRDPRFMVLFAQSSFPQSAREFLASNDGKIDDMFNPIHRDSLVSLTLELFKDMKPKDSAMDYFLRNKCGMNSFKNVIDASKVTQIFANDILAKEFRLSDDKYEEINKKFIRTIEKIIDLGNTKEGILNFIAIPRKHIESSNSKFYASLSQGVPVPVPTEAESFYDSLQKNPSELQFFERCQYETVCPQGRLLRSALTKDNSEIVVIRLRTMGEEVQVKYDWKVTKLAEKIISAMNE